MARTPEQKALDHAIAYGATGRVQIGPETQRIGRATRQAPNPGAMVIVDYAAIEERLMSMAAKRKPKGKRPFKAGGVLDAYWRWRIGMASTAIVVARLARGQGNGEA